MDRLISTVLFYLTNISSYNVKNLILLHIYSKTKRYPTLIAEYGVQNPRRAIDKKRPKQRIKMGLKFYRQVLCIILCIKLIHKILSPIFILVPYQTHPVKEK